jgi:hypothetical protein
MIKGGRCASKNFEGNKGAAPPLWDPHRMALLLHVPQVIDPGGIRDEHLPALHETASTRVTLSSPAAINAEHGSCICSLSCKGGTCTFLSEPVRILPRNYFN